MTSEPLILVINPGSTSTKIALYCGEEQRRERELVHPADRLEAFSTNLAQLEFRLEAILKALQDWDVRITDLQAVIGRGGPLRPMAGGVYRVGQGLLDDLSSGNLIDHASILGGLLASRIAQQNAGQIVGQNPTQNLAQNAGQSGTPAFFADPVSVDEFDEIARISGLPECPRHSRSHALNIKAVGTVVAGEMGKRLEDVNFVIAHLGGGISIAAHRRGRLVDVNNANDSGPFSPERVGTLPLSGLLKLCYSGQYSLAEMKKKLVGKGGLVAHLGTTDCREIGRRIDNGDKHAGLILEAMAYTIAKEIGAMATVLEGDVDAIILTGGLAHDERVVGWITQRVAFIAPVIVKPGQNELSALARHARNALANPSMVKDY